MVSGEATSWAAEAGAGVIRGLHVRYLAAASGHRAWLRAGDVEETETEGVADGTEARAREAQTLGFKKLILPESNKKGLEKLLGIRVVGVKNLEQALDELF